MRTVTEPEFAARLRELLDSMDLADVGSVTGPGRSGAIAAVYASHHLRVPFIPYGSIAPVQLGRLLIVDTATETGQTLRRAMNRYKAALPVSAVAYHEPPRVAFWYESPKPQRYRHERSLTA